MAFQIQSKDIVYGERLGAGGFGEVFEAKLFLHPLLDDRIAPTDSKGLFSDTDAGS